MSAFPQSLRDLAIAKERAQQAFEVTSTLYHAVPADARADETIARAIACRASVDAENAFNVALLEYMKSERAA